MQTDGIVISPCLEMIDASRNRDGTLQSSLLGILSIRLLGPSSQVGTERQRFCLVLASLQRLRRHSIINMSWML